MPTCDAFVVDAFTSEHFAGNQAAVCLFKTPLDDAAYQRLAFEFGYSETAFPVPLNSDDFNAASRFSLRWFTPKCEVDLCGHATLATAHVILNDIGNTNSRVEFETRSGTLTVERSSRRPGCLQINFPQYRIVTLPLASSANSFIGKFDSVPSPGYLSALVSALIPSWMHVEGLAYAPDAKKLLIVLDENTTREQLMSLERASDELLAVHPEGSFVRGVVVTFRPEHDKSFVDADGNPYDFVSRYFAPWVGIAEDPATGSAHCALGPFWHEILGQKHFLNAYQCYPNRGAQIGVELLGDSRVNLHGCSVTFLRGTIQI